MNLHEFMVERHRSRRTAGGSVVAKGAPVVAGGVPVEESLPSRESTKPVAVVAIFEIQRDGSSIWR